MTDITDPITAFLADEGLSAKLAVIGDYADALLTKQADPPPQETGRRLFH
jgi:hypothetical protein